MEGNFWELHWGICSECFEIVEGHTLDQRARCLNCRPCDICLDCGEYRPVEEGFCQDCMYGEEVCYLCMDREPWEDCPETNEDNLCIDCHPEGKYYQIVEPRFEGLKFLDEPRLEEGDGWLAMPQWKDLEDLPPFFFFMGEGAEDWQEEEEDH